MEAARDQDSPEPAFGPDETDTILVGLAVTDQALALRIRAMISQMATVEDVDIDHADEHTERFVRLFIEKKVQAFKIV